MELKLTSQSSRLWYITAAAKVQITTSKIIVRKTRLHHQILRTNLQKLGLKFAASICVVLLRNFHCQSLDFDIIILLQRNLNCGIDNYDVAVWIPASLSVAPNSRLRHQNFTLPKIRMQYRNLQRRILNCGIVICSTRKSRSQQRNSQQSRLLHRNSQ